jgi:hypothetical protein
MRSYDLTELEEMSALSRRTISDYISRGLLAGPSHRGRGARYSQRDLDALRVIPMLRTVLKPEFPNLNSVRSFLDSLTISDLRHLVRISNERVFEIEVRRIRILNRLKPFLPAVPPESLSKAMSRMTPEQICGVDRGQIQIGTLLDIELISGEQITGARDVPGYEGDVTATSDDAVLNAAGVVRLSNGYAGNHTNGNGHANGQANGHTNGDGYADAEANGNGIDTRWERFGNSTVEVRIEKKAFGNVSAGPRLSDTIRDFAAQIETLLKAPS